MSLRELFASRDRASVLLTICGLSFLVNFGRVAFAPLVDHFIQLGIGPAVAGLAATAVWLGSALPRLPTGWLLTFLRRHTVLIGVGVWLALAALLTALSVGIWMTIAGAFAIGLATGAFFIAANPLVSELYPHNVGTAIGFRGMFSQIAAVSAPFLVAISITLASWRVGFIGMAAVTIVVTIGFVIAIRQMTLPRAGEYDRELIQGIRSQWRLILSGIVFVGFIGFVWQGVFNFYITYLTAEKALTSNTATSLLTLMFAAGVPSFLIGGHLADRFSFLKLFLSVLSSFALCLYLLTVVDEIVFIVILSIILGFIIHNLFPIGDAYILSSIPDDHRASGYAGFSATMMLIQAPGSVAVGLFAQTGISYGRIFQGYAIVVAGLAVGMSLLVLMGRVPTGR